MNSSLAAFTRSNLERIHHASRSNVVSILEDPIHLGITAEVVGHDCRDPHVAMTPGDVEPPIDHGADPLLLARRSRNAVHRHFGNEDEPPHDVEIQLTLGAEVMIEQRTSDPAALANSVIETSAKDFSSKTFAALTMICSRRSSGPRRLPPVADADVILFSRACC